MQPVDYIDIALRKREWVAANLRSLARGPPVRLARHRITWLKGKPHGRRATLSLRDGWFVKQIESPQPDIAALTREVAVPDTSWLTATLPAQAHDVLLAHGRIPDPRIGKNAAESAWVGDKDWAYACLFASPKWEAGPVVLRFGGLDTLASAYLNGVLIGTFDNMFREYAVPVQAHLAPPGQTNTLLIIFSAPLRFVREVQQPPTHVGRIAKHKYFRKSANDFGSYLGARPHAVKVGIYRDVVLDMRESAWLEDVWVRTQLSPDHARATVRVQVIARGEPATVEWTLIDPTGQEVACGSAAADEEIIIPVDDPRLWWPWTHGTPHLYRLHVRLRRGSDFVDQRDLTVGIRTIDLIAADQASGEKRFAFAVNGKRLFLQGACWAPIEGMSHCWQPERAQKLLDLAQHGRMDLLRIWGGGHVPPPDFYAECDRRGILVWQDFMFEYGMYPSGDAAFDENCRAEVEGVIRRLRNHPCLLLWCGGNENYMGWDFAVGGAPTIGRELFEQILPDACARLDPDRPFHPSSPFGGQRPNWPLEGDWHDYTTLTFSHESSVPTFVSELGRVSALSPRNMRRFLSAEEYWPAEHDPAIRAPGQAAWPPMWQYRSVDGSWDKVGALEAFCDPATAEDLIRILGTAHGEYLQRSVERLRRGVPDGAADGSRRCGGNMVWRLNDAWPILYWSVIDYYLEPKIAFYFLRRAYAPVLLSFERTPDRLAIWVINDSADVVSGALVVRRRRFDGALRAEVATNVEVPPGQSRRCLDTVELGPISLRDEFLQASFAGREALYLLTGERYLHLPRTALDVRYISGTIEVSAGTFARQVALEREGATGAAFEDNYFDVAPGETRRIKMLDASGENGVTVRAANAGPVRVEWH